MLIGNYLRSEKIIPLTHCFPATHSFKVFDKPNDGLFGDSASFPRMLYMSYLHSGAPSRSLTQRYHSFSATLQVFFFSPYTLNVHLLCRISLLLKHALLGIQIDTLKDNIILSGSPRKYLIQFPLLCCQPPILTTLIT